MKIVNGYVCECSDEVRLAKRGVDPDNPHNDPVKAEELREKHGKTETKPLEETQGSGFDPNPDAGFPADAVRFGGRLEGLSAGGEERSPAERLLDLLA